MVMFIMYFVTTIYITSNYRKGLEKTVVESNALNILVHNVENLKQKSYDELTSETINTKIYEKDYKCDIHVQNFLKNGYTQVDDVKDITVTVEYVIDGETQNISASLIREAVSYEN